MKSVIIGLDFDGTVVKHAYPEIGAPLEGCISTLKLLQEHGHKIMLWTMRSGEELVHAVKYLEDNGILLWAANVNPTQHSWSKSNKQYAHCYIDDASIGCPLIYPEGDKPYVDWTTMKYLLKQANILPMDC